MEQDRQTCTTPQENSKKCGARMKNQKNLIARLQFSMMILWRRLHRDFLRFVNWTRPFERSGNFYEAARGQHPAIIILSFDCWEPQLSKKYRVERGYPIFQGQKYSSCSKAAGCRTAELLGAFLTNLLIVSWVTPTPGCTGNFPGNPCSKPPILPPFGRSGQELPVECQVEPFPTNFFVVYS